MSEEIKTRRRRLEIEDVGGVLSFGRRWMGATS